MDMTLKTIEDFIRIVKSSPTLQLQVKKALFPDIDSPRPFAALSESQRQTQIILQELAVRVADLEQLHRRTEAMLQKYLAKIDRVEDNAQQLNMRVGRVEDNLQELNRRVGRVEVKIEEAAQERQGIKEEAAIEREAIREEAGREREAIREEASQERQAIRDDLSVVKRRQNDLRGRTYEQQFGNRADGIFGRFLRRGRKVRNEVGLHLEEAEQNEQISEEEHDQVLACDLLWGGKLKSTKEEIVLVVEISWLAEAYDVERAVKRAHILRLCGLKAFPVVAGIEWVEGLSTQAMSQGVIMVTDLRLDKPSWRAVV
jgi:outer membrane murein-binding lipoprotein Lpp